MPVYDFAAYGCPERRYGMSGDIWGPWILHDGKGCPCRVGEFVHTIEADGEEWAGLITRRLFEPDEPGEVNVWIWERGFLEGYPDWRVIRYRIKRPRALIQLIEMVEALPAPAREREDA